MNSFLESFLELIYPEKNICCICNLYDESIGDKYICTNCYNKIKKIIPPYCIKCCKPIDFNSDINICPECIRNHKFFETSKSPFLYDGLIKDSIYNFKYHNKPYLYKFLGMSLVQYMQSIDYIDFDFIIPVPLHPVKMKKRGYNQSELIAKYISNKLNIPYINGLKRIKNTDKQSSQTKQNRNKNLKNAFMITHTKGIDKIKKSSVLIVDDIYTTGSTANECAKTLLNFSVDKVFIITIAR